MFRRNLQIRASGSEPPKQKNVMSKKAVFLLVALFAGMMGLSLASCTDASSTNVASATTPSTNATSTNAASATAPSQNAASQQVAAPALSPTAGTYAGAQSVTISTTTSGAAIRYTTDGTTPTEKVGTVYSSPLNVATTETIMAIAYEAGWTDSIIAIAAYTIAGTVATPSFSPHAGTYSSDQSVTISCDTSGAAIHYTTDGSPPTSSSATYTAPISVAGNGTSETITAIATDSDMTASRAGTATYIINYQVSTPAFNPVAGTYSSDQSVTINCATSGAAIHYTTDGSPPTNSSATYAAAIPVAGNGINETIRAMATATKMASSSMASAAYSINYSQVSTPNFSLIAGTYPSDQLVTISCATSGAAIYYTTDTTTPSASSPSYGAPISVAGNGTTSTVKAFAIKEGMTASSVGAASYIISYPQVSTPAFNPSAGTYSRDRSVTISSSTRGAAIHYTTDGSTPNSSSATYTAPISVVGNGTNETIKAIATTAGMTASRVGTVTYVIYDTWQTVGTPGSGSNQFNHPTGAAVDASGHIYITDYGNNRIVRMDDMSGTGWTAFGAQGGGGNQFHFPARVAVDASGHIYIADMSNSRIVRMDDMSGSGWTAFGSFGSGTNQFINPAGVAVDPKGHVYIADSGNNRIVRLDDMRGTGWTVLGTRGNDSNQFNDPVGAAIDASGHIYIADYGNYRIVRMDDMTGSTWTTLGGTGHSDHGGTNQFSHPAGVAVMSVGTFTSRT